MANRKPLAVVVRVVVRLAHRSEDLLDLGQTGVPRVLTVPRLCRGLHRLLAPRASGGQQSAQAAARKAPVSRTQPAEDAILTSWSRSGDE